MRSRSLVTSVVAATALALTAVPAASSPLRDSGGPSPGGFTSDNVEWLSVNPLHTGTAGGRLHDGYFYVTDPRGVYIYDVAEPETPSLTGFVNVFQSGLGVVLAQEDPDTNGKILLVDAIDPAAPGDGAQLLVIDVRDKAAPAVVGSVDVTDHTWTCVLDCTYAFGRSGNIVDLTDPTNPVHLDADWRSRLSRAPSYTHDFTEVRPGFVVSSGQPSYYIDVRNPDAGVELNQIRTNFPQFGFHGARWPNDGTDRFLLMGTEIAPPGSNNLAGSDCDGPGGLFVYDATEVLAADRFQEENPDLPRPPAEFHQLGKWNIARTGTLADGNAPGHVLFCEHWFDAHPAFDAGGLVAMGTYTNGTRFLEVDAEGQIEEVGWFQPIGGYTGAAYWITDEIVYVHDYVRGLDILRFTNA